MQGLIQKSGYIKPGEGAGNYAEYIATRDGVELLIRSSLYMEYIAERPRSHGLFSNTECTDLARTMNEVSSHPAPVWTFIYSLRREDAARLGYDSAESWRRLLLAHQTELAEAMKIPPNLFRWCAAFHDEKHHPHIHMMVWSADPMQGYLTEQGIETMRYKLTNDIFQDELLHLYKQKDLSYQEVRDTAQEAMSRLIREMESGMLARAGRITIMWCRSAEVFRRATETGCASSSSAGRARTLMLGKECAARTCWKSCVTSCGSSRRGRIPAGRMPVP